MLKCCNKGVMKVFKLNLLLKECEAFLICDKNVSPKVIWLSFLKGGAPGHTSGYKGERSDIEKP